MFKRLKQFLKKVGNKITSSEVTLLILFIIALIITILDLAFKWYVIYKVILKKGI